ncbi:MAG: transcription-repair coupling factor [Clostridia bacterium]|nr:transcription-repair coupling factor [Clostridia bacterium]
MTEKLGLDCIFSPLGELEPYRLLREAISKAGVWSVVGMAGSERLHLLASLVRDSRRPLLLIAATEQSAARSADDLTQLLGGGVALFPAREVSFLRVAASSRELSIQRLDALGRAVQGEIRALVAPADALMHRLMPRTVFEEHILTLRAGQQIDPAQLMTLLTEAGYERVGQIEGRGQCALRGGILDVYPSGGENAARIEFFDDEIDTIRDMDVLTQRSIGLRESLSVYPASEVLLTAQEAKEAAERLRAALSVRTERTGSGKDRQAVLEETYGLMPIGEFQKLLSDEDDSVEEKADGPAQRSRVPRTALGRNFASRLDALSDGHCFSGAESLMPILRPDSRMLFEYLDNPIVVLDQPDRLRERCDNRMLEFREYFKTALEREDAVGAQGELLFSWDEILAKAQKNTLVALNPLRRSMPDLHPRGETSLRAVACAGYQGSMSELKRDLNEYVRNGYRVAIHAGGTARGQRLSKSLFDLDVDAPLIDPPPEALSPGCVTILARALGKGFVYPDLRFCVITENDIFGSARQKRMARTRNGEKLSAFTDLKIGDYVVHENHGIGRYMGTVRLASEGTYRDYLHIQYTGADKLYVPVDQLDRVQKYIGAEGAVPKLNSLSGGEWQQQKARVRASIQEMAGDLIKLYAERTSRPGYAFQPDTPWQREMEDEFEYEETPDQINAIAEIKRDMESPRIMDRLLCGDVGYGKTEVAIRAIFKCVMSGKQAALLAPTTILTAQHYATLQKRFEHFPVRIGMLSRFRTASQQKATIQALREGELDVVVGTHRMLGKDVEFRDLGLLVVDEEQRFGVRHKEAIKKLKKNVDVLTLSATPIPRTLHMSMIGIRDMSLLQTPPEERYPVQTYVVEYSDGLVRDAILREMARGGQVYVLHNRVNSIEMMYARLKKLLPEARIAIGHGQMREHALEDVMMDFYVGKYDVLLCTTIIEAGLDVPMANTLIVCDADRFGLAQLYQLRGRVGRSNRLAYAFLTVNPNKILSETADKRLSAIREFTEFGSGFRVAMRDLEIRGTGNLLGAAQSGHMASVGYDLYVKMIEEAVRTLRGAADDFDIQARIEIRVDAFLPSDYVRDDLTRVEIYKKISAIRTDADREDLIEELIDRFGDPVRPVMNLIDIAQLKATCELLGIDSVSQRGSSLLFRFAPTAELDPERLIPVLKKHEKYVRLIAGKETSIQYSGSQKSAEDRLHDALKLMREIAAETKPETPAT